MGKGLATGTILGGVTGAALLAVVSLYAPIPAVGQIHAKLSESNAAPQDGDVQVAADGAMDLLVGSEADADTGGGADGAEDLTLASRSRPSQRPQPSEVAAVEPEPQPEPEVASPAVPAVIEVAEVVETELSSPEPEPEPAQPNQANAAASAEAKPALVLETQTLAAPVPAVATVKVAALRTVDTVVQRPTGLVVRSNTYTIPEVDLVPAKATKPNPPAAAKPGEAKSAGQQPEVETKTASALNRGGALNTTNRLNSPDQKAAGKTLAPGASVLTPVKPIVGGDTGDAGKTDDIRSRFKGAGTNSFQSKRLPTVTAPAVDGDEAVVAAAAGATSTDEGALRKNAAKFEVTPGDGLISVILLDVGDPGLARDQLKNVGIPITIAVDPSAPNAREIMNTYRSAGLEVVAWLEDLPKAASPADVEVALAGYFSVIDEAVAVLDPLDGRIQGSPRLLSPVLGVLSETGHGFITQKRRLSGATQAADRDGVPSALITKMLDGGKEKSAEIKRYLDKAALNASTNGSAILVGHPYPETVRALIEWTLENKVNDVNLAPVSAILLQDES